MEKEKIIKKIKNFPDSPGIYIMRDTKRRPIYIGKASSLKRRVLSYFQRPQEERLEQALSKLSNIDFQKTDSVIEALFFGKRFNKKIQTEI